MSKVNKYGPLVLTLAGVALLVGLIPSAVSAVQSAVDITSVQRALNAMTSTIIVHFSDGSSTTFFLCTDYRLLDNGTVTFKGREGSDTGEIVTKVFGPDSFSSMTITDG